MSRIPRRGRSRRIADETDPVNMTYLRLHVGRFRRPTVAGFPNHDRPFGCRAGQDVVLGGLG